VRCIAYHLEEELYRDLEAQILELISDGDRQTLVYLLSEATVEVEMLAGEWPLLFAEAKEFYQRVDIDERIARMAVSPDGIEDFIDLIHEPRLSKLWKPISFGMSSLRHRFGAGEGDGGLVFVEESDDWMWIEHPYEVMALRPEVYELLKPQIERYRKARDFAALSRMVADHCEGAVEFSEGRWNKLISMADERVPELSAVIGDLLTTPADYYSIREAIALVADPADQPSLDAWLRVHADSAQYALFFRDTQRERE
jgi:hypothetical protein